MLKQLRAARADNSHDRKLAKLASLDLLIIDDLGLRPLIAEEPVDLYELIRLRYERASTLITSNRDTDELARLFGDPLLASAAMDRLLHAAHVLRLQGDTYRNPRTPRKGNQRNNNQPEVTT